MVENKRKRRVYKFNERREMPQDDYLTACKECKHGIFKGQERLQTKRGLIHLRCRTNEDVDVA